MRNGTGGPGDRTSPSEENCSPPNVSTERMALNVSGAGAGADNVSGRLLARALSRRVLVAFESERQQGARPTCGTPASLDLAQQACAAGESQHAKTTGRALWALNRTDAIAATTRTTVPVCTSIR